MAARSVVRAGKTYFALAVLVTVFAIRGVDHPFFANAHPGARVEACERRALH